jgi:hypothetical protein
MAKRSFDRPERHAHAGAWLGAKVCCLFGPDFLSTAGNPAQRGDRPGVRGVLQGVAHTTPWTPVRREDAQAKT